MQRQSAGLANPMQAPITNRNFLGQQQQSEMPQNWISFQQPGFPNIPHSASSMPQNSMAHPSANPVMGMLPVVPKQPSFSNQLYNPFGNCCRGSAGMQSPMVTHNPHINQFNANQQMQRLSQQLQSVSMSPKQPLMMSPALIHANFGMQWVVFDLLI